MGAPPGRFRTDGVVFLNGHPDVQERFFPHIAAGDDPIEEGTWILPLSPESSAALTGESLKPAVLASEDMGPLLPLLPESMAAVRSGVLIPLCIHQTVFGCLFLGSFDPQRYHPKDGTELLEQLGVKIALCMDNCLAYERVKEFTLKDPLTGLLNFFQVHTALQREVRKARRLARPLSILVVDFAYFHDPDGSLELGHEILKHASGILNEILTQEECYIGRYGSDEFLVILPNVSEEEAREVIPYLNQMVRKTPFKVGNAAILIQTNIGVGTLKNGMRSQDLLDEATNELCASKVSHPARE